MKSTKKTDKNASPFVLYKGKPLVRCGNTIYYGNLSDKYVIKMEVKDSFPKEDLNISSRVQVEMMDTNPNSDTKKIVKVSEKNGLYDAIDIAEVWLKRAENLN